MNDEWKRLDDPGEPITFSNGTTLAGLGGAGSVRQRRPDSGRLRSAVPPAALDTSAGFERALAELRIHEQETITLDASELRTGADDTLRLTPALAVGDDAPRVVLYQDESGGISWHFAPTAADPGLVRGGLRTQQLPPLPHFVIPLRTAAARSSLRVGLPRRNLRGPISVVGRKLFKVLVLPVLSALLADPLRWFGEKVERRYRQQLIWQLTPDNYRQAPQAAAEAAAPAAEMLPTVDWSRLRHGPVLLLLHGIFSSVEGMLAGLPRSAMQSWHDRYQGRVLAFNHLTVSRSPEENARDLLTAIERELPGVTLTVDILSHSRGGIVARTLAERAEELLALSGSGCRVRSVYFVATPNSGSPLGDAEHLVDMIDLFTNCLTAFPDGPAAYSIEVLLGLVMLVANAGVRGLPGIAALGTCGSYVTDTLNRASHQPSPALYSAAAADFAPQPGRDNGWLIDRFGDPLMDRVFAADGRPVANDLVVPQRSVFAANGHPSFPIASPLVFGTADGVWHSAFFAEPRTITHIGAHFDRVTQVALARRPRFRRADPTTRGGASGFEPTSKEAPSVPARQDYTVVRDPKLDFPGHLEAGARANLVVRLELPGAGPTPAERMSLAFEPGSEAIELVAEVSAPGFTVEGQRHATLRLLRERDTALESASFRLKAIDPGSQPLERTIVVSFFRGNDCVGGVSQQTVVVPRGCATPTANGTVRCSPVHVAAQHREAADLLVCLRRSAIGKDVFELSLRSQVPGEEYESRAFGSFDLDGKKLPCYLGEALDPIFDRFPGADVANDKLDAVLAKWNEDLLTTLADLGKQLWTHLPEPFRAEYLRLMALDERPRSLFILSDELSFPWEIVRPSGVIHDRYEELQPLGVAHVLGRWRPGIGARPQPQALPVTSMAIIVPNAADSGLPWAAEEVAQLRQLLPFAHPITPAKRKQLQQLLADDDAQIVHFSGHGYSGANADLTALVLEGGESITAMAFAASRLGSTHQPVLFLNACTVGRGGRVLGRAGGFAGNCIESGWSGVVAPYWPVLDASAAKFGVAFYRKLKAGRTIGEALCELRSESPDDPTAQAYAYFGDPFARVLLL